MCYLGVAEIKMCHLLRWRKIKSPPETAWSALRAANQKAARMGDSLGISAQFSTLATLYEKSRTYFQRNGG